MKTTPSILKQLAILAEHGPLSPNAFAHFYFDGGHPGWTRGTRCGHGTRRGGGLVLWAGGALGKLRKQKFATLVRGDFDRHQTAISAAGRAVLGAK
jgi:hypothetical protein